MSCLRAQDGLTPQVCIWTLRGIGGWVWGEEARKGEMRYVSLARTHAKLMFMCMYMPFEPPFFPLTDKPHTHTYT